MKMGIPLLKLVLFIWLMRDIGYSLPDDTLVKMSELIKSSDFHHGSQQCTALNTCRYHYQCSCDETCLLYDDCCEDFNPGNFAQEFAPMTEYMSCMEMEWDGQTFMGISHSVISQCPEMFPDENIIRRCHKPDLNSALDNIPVTSSMTLLTYKNKFCAQCHNLKKENVLMWNIVVNCKSFIDNPPQQFHLPEIVKSLLSTNSCGFQYTLFKNVLLRDCLPFSQHMYVDDCPEGYDQRVRQLCRKFYQPLFIYYKNTVYRYYRNKYCLQCDNTLVNASVLNSFTLKCKPGMQVNRLNPFIVMLNFSSVFYESASLGLKSESRPLCRESEVYINKLEKCVTLHCPESSFARDSICIPYHQQFNNFAVRASFHINGSVNGGIIKERLQRYPTNIAFNCGKYQPTSDEHANSISLLTGTDSRSNQSCMIAIMQQVFRQQGFVNYTYESQCIKFRLQQFSEELTDDVFITYINDIRSTSCIVNENGRVLSFKMTPFVRIQTETLTCPSIDVYALRNRGRANQNEDDMQNNTTEELFGIHGIQVDAQNVKATPNGYFICWSVFKKYYDVSAEIEDMNIYTIITHVCMGLSTASLLVTIGHYCIVPKLLTNHSVLLLHLVVISFLSRSLYMVGLYIYPDTDACWTISVVLHCLFLILFTSSSLALLQITKQLRSMKNPFVKKGVITTLIRYVLSGYIVSFSIVGSTALVKIIRFSDDVWYGRQVCFISDPYVLFYSFALPVAASLVCNFSVFSFTVRFFCLHRLQQDTIVIVNRNYFLLSLKLSMLLGISWLVGYIAVITNNAVLVVVFEVGTALHGVMLSVGLLSNRAVNSWYKAKCSCGRE